MKLCVTMKKNKNYDVYTFKGKDDKRFFILIQILSDDFKPGELIDWLMDDKRTVEGNEFVDIRKEKGVIAFYDISDGLNDDIYISIFPDLAKRFELSVKNFTDILFEWEKLRVSRPDIILIVIHEDNHVSLEADPHIIKEYQDAGYAFDSNHI